jgi:transposase
MSNAKSFHTTYNVYNKCEEDKDYWGVYWLNKEKYSLNRISKVIGILRSTVQNIVKMIENKWQPTTTPHTGAPKKLTERD